MLTLQRLFEQWGERVAHFLSSRRAGEEGAAEITPAADPASRITRPPRDVLDLLCGPGFEWPEGAEEVLRLARPLGLTEAHSVLVVGAGRGGPVAALAATFKSWVSGFEADPARLAYATRHCARSGCGKRATVAPFDPAEPQFPLSHFHHVMALGALRGAPHEPLLRSLAQALRPFGQIVFVDFVAEPADLPALAAWARLEGHPATLPEESALTALLERWRFDVRVVEDLTARHVAAALHAWHHLVRTLESDRPTPAEARLIVAEAERWLHRVRLMQSRKLRLVRWHAIAPPPPLRLE
jgi:SAM-dependent methyltransferase